MFAHFRGVVVVGDVGGVVAGLLDHHPVKLLRRRVVLREHGVPAAPRVHPEPVALEVVDSALRELGPVRLG